MRCAPPLNAYARWRRMERWDAHLYQWPLLAVAALSVTKGWKAAEAGPSCVGCAERGVVTAAGELIG